MPKARAPASHPAFMALCAVYDRCQSPGTWYWKDVQRPKSPRQTRRQSTNAETSGRSSLRSKGASRSSHHKDRVHPTDPWSTATTHPTKSPFSREVSILFSTQLPRSITCYRSLQDPRMIDVLGALMGLDMQGFNAEASSAYVLPKEFPPNFLYTMEDATPNIPRHCRHRVLIKAGARPSNIKPSCCSNRGRGDVRRRYGGG